MDEIAWNESSFTTTCSGYARKMERVGEGGPPNGLAADRFAHKEINTYQICLALAAGEALNRWAVVPNLEGPYP